MPRAILALISASGGSSMLPTLAGGAVPDFRASYSATSLFISSAWLCSPARSASSILSAPPAISPPILAAAASNFFTHDLVTAHSRSFLIIQIT